MWYVGHVGERDRTGTRRPSSGGSAAGSFRDVIRTVEAMRADGVISQYAVGGAVAFIVWDEPVATGDVDVIVLVPQETNALDPLRPVLDWLAAHSVRLDGEHAIIAGVAVQFLPAWNSLVIEGVREAAAVPYEGASLRVLRPAYLVASWRMDPSADTFPRRERAARLLEAGLVTNDEIDTLIRRHGR